MACWAVHLLHQRVSSMQEGTLSTLCDTLPSMVPGISWELIRNLLNMNSPSLKDSLPVKTSPQRTVCSLNHSSLESLIIPLLHNSLLSLGPQKFLVLQAPILGQARIRGNATHEFFLHLPAPHPPPHPSSSRSPVGSQPQQWSLTSPNIQVSALSSEVPAKGVSGIQEPDVILMQCMIEGMVPSGRSQKCTRKK